MKATILNGAQHNQPYIDVFQTLIISELQQIGVETVSYTLRDNKVAYCTGCFECWVKTPGVCKIKDENHDIAADAIYSDLLIYLSPIVFGSYSSTLKKAVDHLIPLISPFFKQVNGETHHHKRYSKYPDLIGIGFQTKPNPTQAVLFGRLVERNAINFHSGWSASAVYQHDDNTEMIRQSIRQMLQSRVEMVS